MWLCETTTTAVRAARHSLPFVRGLFSLCSLCSIVSAARHAPSCSILCYLYSSVICKVLHAGSLWEHNGATPRTSKASLWKHDHSEGSKPMVMWGPERVLPWRPVLLSISPNKTIAHLAITTPTFWAINVPPICHKCPTFAPNYAEVFHTLSIRSYSNAVHISIWITASCPANIKHSNL